MMIKRTAVLVFLLLGGAVTLGAADQPKFRSSGPGDSGTGRYLVTLTGDGGTEELAAIKGDLAVLYGARVEPGTSTDVRQFAVTMTTARARLLSSDPRVSAVAEAPQTQPSPSATVSSARRFTTQTTGYGDNGQSGVYAYDSSGNITAIGSDTYFYDLEGRLKVSLTRGVEEDYTYDAFGNRKTATGATNCLGQTTCAQPVTLDTPTTTNRLLTINGGAVTYDPAGNVTKVTGVGSAPDAVYVYDGTAMMTQATVGSDDRQFVYTADDERIAVRRGASWTWTVRDQSEKVLREFTSVETGGANFAMTNRQWVKDYVWRDGLLLATTSPSGTLHYHLDHLGTPRLITDANHVKVAEHAYYPFGAEINLTPHETPEEAMKFTGHERDIVAGDGHTLDYMHARYDNATNGRFLSVDPYLDVKSASTNPQIWNRYPYVSNSPLKYTDPTGKANALAIFQPVPQDNDFLLEGGDGGGTSGDGSGTTRLPSDPSQLPDYWQVDSGHKNPNGKLWRDPNGNVLEWHQGQPGKKGWRGKDHWHYRPGGEGGEEHLKPGDEIPSPSAKGVKSTRVDGRLSWFVNPGKWGPDILEAEIFVFSGMALQAVRMLHGDCGCGH